MSSNAWPVASAPRRALLTVAITAITVLAGLLAAPLAHAQTSMPVLLTPQVVAGPSSAIDSLNGLSVARDGSGGMVFLETVGGAPHVFVSRLVQGAWQAPEQIDVGLSGPSSQPQITADNHGELLVAFVNSGTVYVSGVTNSTQPFPAPQALGPGVNPAISINTFGVAYLAYTAPDGSGDDVDVDYFNGSTWSAASPQAVNVTAGDNAGTGAGAPDVIAAGDGVGIVTWGENGHIYARRVWGTMTSVETMQLDPSSVAGWSEVTADSPEISAGGDSSYPDIAFREQVTSGGKTQSRVLVTRVIAEDTQSAVPVDTLGAGSDGASQPQLAMNEFGQGFVTAATTSGHQLIDTPLASSGALGTPTVLTPGGGTAQPYAVPANAGLTSNLIAWQQTPATGSAQILLSYAPNGTDLSTPLVLSTAANGPTDAAKGLFAGGDRNGDAAVVWVQGPANALSIDSAELITAPGAAGDRKKVTYTNSNAPLLAWTGARENWGAVAYNVSLDGSSVGQTSNLGWQLPGPLTDGPHSYTVIVTNQASQSSTTLTRTIFVDTYPPVVKTNASGKPQAGRKLTLRLRYTDPPNPAEPGSKASGVASETVNWGDHTAVVTGKRLLAPRHVYRRRGRYTVTVTVTDRAGNATTSTRVLTIKPQPKPRSKRRVQRKPATLALAANAPARTGAAVQGPVTAPSAAAPPTRGALMSDGPTNRYQLGGTWMYRPDPTNTGIASGWWQYNTDTANWNPVTMPNSFNANSLTNASFNGSVGWYRRDFTVPANAFPNYVPRSAQRWVLQFESVNYRATVWLNGHKLGTHAGAYLPFEFTMKYLRRGVNQLIVRVDDRLNGGTFPHSVAGWWNYGGILDAVYMRPVSGSEIDNVQIRTTLACPTCSATIEEQATVRNLSDTTEAVSLTGHFGTSTLTFGSATIRPGATWTPSASVVIASPQLWAPGSPYLYRATFSLADSRGRRIAGYSYQSGIRQITLAGGQLYVNGRPLHLMGVNLHEQAVNSGAALTMAQQRQLISWVQQLGGTIIRAHYPLDPELEQMADQAGIMLWSEVPVYQAAASYQADPSWRNRATALLGANIQANQNHPSILVWSIGNELGSPPSAGQAAYIRQAAAAAKKLDPTRPVGMAVTDWPGLGCQSAYAPLQVIGVNEYFDWFDAGGGTTDDRDELAPFLQSVHACYPNQGIFVSEWGFGANRDGPVEVRGTYAYQSNSIAYTVGVFNTLSWLSGAMYFPMQDFAARPGWDGQDPLGTPPWVDKGVLDQYGNPKPGFAVMASQFQGSQQIGPPSLTALRMPTATARR